MSATKKMMGSVQLQFMEFTGDRKYYKYANGSTMFKAFAKWNPFKKHFKHRDHVCVLTVSKDAPDSKSGCSYDILGVLYVTNNLQDLRDFNKAYLDWLVQATNDHQKIVAAKMTADYACDWLEKCEQKHLICNNTRILLEMLFNGEDLKEVTKLAKAIAKH